MADKDNNQQYQCSQVQENQVNIERYLAQTSKDIQKNAVIHMLQKETASSNLDKDYLRDVQNGKIPPEMREELIQWILLLCEKYGFQHITRMLSIHYVDQFLRLNNKVEFCTLRLIGIAAIILAAKIQEDKLLSFEQGALDCDGEYEPAMIQKVERMILILLDFNAIYPTPMDFLQFFLYMSDPTFGFQDFINECLNFTYLCLLDYRLSRFRPSSIAIGSIFQVFDQKGQEWASFRNQWENYISANFPTLINIQQSYDCYIMMNQLFMESEKENEIADSPLEDDDRMELTQDSTFQNIQIWEG